MLKEYQDKITDIVQQNNIVLFMKGDKNQPMCGFSSHAVNLLNHLSQKLNTSYVDVDVLADNDLKEQLKLFSQWPTIPQLYIGQKFIGGLDIMMEMHKSAELEKAIQALLNN